MFNFLKGNQTSLNVVLDHPNGIYYPGDTLQAMINLSVDKALKIQEGRVALICKESYEYTTYEESTDSDGNTSTDLTTKTRVEDYEVRKDFFLAEGALEPTAGRSFRFSARIPDDALPSLSGHIVWVSWMVKATLARKLAADINSVASITVPALLSGEKVSGRYGESNLPADVQLSLELAGLDWLAGDTLAGNLVVIPQAKFDVSELRIELVQSEVVDYDRGKRSDSQVKVKLAGKTALEPGKPFRVPFQIQIPAAGLPSAASGDWSVSWKLKGVLGRFLQKDPQVEQEIRVYNRQGK